MMKKIHQILKDIWDDQKTIGIIKHICKIDWNNSVLSDLHGLLLAVGLVCMPEDENEDEDRVLVPDEKYVAYFDFSDVEEIALNR